MTAFLAAIYPWTKAFHIIAMTAWMAGLFYLPRLFVYHAERAATPGETSEMFKTMERRLLRAIMNPAMIATWTFGLALAFTPGILDWSAGWFHVKLTAVAGMTWFHHWLARRRKDFARDANTVPPGRYRAMNETPTALLVVIVVMVVVRPF